MQAEVPGGAPGGPGPPGGQQVVTPGLLLAELQCPICVEVIADPFVTPCGHTFCYQCITTHLKHQSNCPSCRSYLVQEQVHPNFLLDKILARAAGTAPVPGGATSAGSLQRVLQQALSGGGQLRGPDIDAAIQVLQAARRQLSNQENSSNLQLLLLFLQQARSHKAATLGELDAQLGVLAADIRTAVLGHISDPAHLATWAAAAAAAAAAGRGGAGPAARPGDPSAAALPSSLEAAAAAAAAAGGGGGGDAWASRASGAGRPAAGSGPGAGAPDGLTPGEAGGALEAATIAAAPAMQQLAQLRQLLLQQQALAASRGPGAPLPPAAPVPAGSGVAGEGGPRSLPRVNSFPHLLTLPMGAAEEALAGAAAPGATPATAVQALLQQQQQQQQQQVGGGGGAGPSSVPGPVPGPASVWRGAGPSRWGPRPAGALPLGPGAGEGQTELAAHLQQQQQQQAAAGVLEGPSPVAGAVAPGGAAAAGPRLGSAGAPLLAAPGRPGVAPPTFRPGPRLGPGLGSSSGGFQPYLAASPPAAAAGGAPGAAALVGAVPGVLGGGGVPTGDGGWGLLPGSPGSPRGGGDDAGDCCSVAPPVSRREDRAAAAGVEGGSGGAAAEADPPPATALPGAPPGQAGGEHRSSAADEEDTAGGLAGAMPLGGDGGGGSGAALPASRKRKILAQYPALAEAYLASRLHMGGPGAAPAAAAAAGAAPAAAAAGARIAGATPAVPGTQEPPAAAQHAGDARDSAAADAAAPAAAEDAAAPGDGLAGENGAPRVTSAAEDGEGPALGWAPGSGPDGAPLAAFSHVLSSVTRFSRLALLGCVPPPTQPGASSASILTAADWDCGGQLAAVAGAAGRISCYSYTDLTAGASAGSGAGGGGDTPTPPLPPGPSPVLELPSRTKLSCLSFSPAVAGALLAGDGEGGVASWDCAVGRCTGRWEAHSRRLHALHHSAPHPGRWASGSDDGTVKVWEGGGCTPSLTLAVGVPVCSVRYHPTTPHLLAVGSAKHAVLLYDLRAPATPLAALAGHAKAVSYVRWQEPSTSNTPPAAAAAAAAAEVAEEGGPQPMEVLGAAGEGEGGTAHGSSSSNGQAGTGSSAALVSASVDSTLRRWVWDPAAAGGGSSAPAPAAPTSPGAAGWRCERLFSGHTTTKAFTGLSVEGPYIATGSETNQVYLYHAAMSGPAATARLPLPGGGPGGGVGCTGDVFVSAVAWRRGSRVLLATNSAGGVYVLGLSG